MSAAEERRRSAVKAGRRMVTLTGNLDAAIQAAVEEAVRVKVDPDMLYRADCAPGSEDEMGHAANLFRAAGFEVDE